MKKFLTLTSFLILSLCLGAQDLQQLSYQAVIRDNAHQVLSEQNIGLEISIIKDSPEGEVLYVETHFTTTNSNGLISLEIGAGTIQSGDFSAIDWSSGSYYMGTQIDPLGGSDYTISGTSKIQSVPHALHASIADSVKGTISVSQITGLENYRVQEEQNLDSILSLGNDGGEKQIKNIALPTDSNDVATKIYVDDQMVKVFNGLINARNQGVVGDGVTDDTQAIIDLFEAANGAPVYFPTGIYRIDGTAITTEHISLSGVMPKYMGDSLSLGTVFKGKLSFTGTHVSIENIGVDLHGEAADDGLRVTPTINTGDYCEIHNVITVGADKSSAFHSFIIEGFEKVNISNIEVRDAYMGVVMKVNGGILSNIRTYSIAREGLFLKSDATFGNCKDLIVEKVYIENTAADVSTGIKILSSGAQFQNINLSDLFIRHTQIGLAIVSSGTEGVAINNINISNLKVDFPSLFALYLEANKGFIYAVNINNVDATNIKNFMTTKGKVKYLNLNNVTFNTLTNVTDAEKAAMITIGADTKRTNLSNIIALKGYNEDIGLAINYENPGVENRLVNHNLRLIGGKPESGKSEVAITGTGNSIQPVLSTINERSFITLIPDADGTEVNAISIIPNDGYESELFTIGYELKIRNNSNYDLTIKYNYAGRIVNPGLVDVVVKAQSWVTYVFSGSVWNKME